DGNEEVVETGQVSVSSCGEISDVEDLDGYIFIDQQPIIIQQTSSVFITRVQIKVDKIFEVHSGDAVLVPVQIKNLNDDIGEFTVSISDSGVVKAKILNVLVEGNTEKGVILKTEIERDVAPGEYQATIDVFEGSRLITSEKVIFRVVSDGAYARESKGWLWFFSVLIIDILLLLIIVYLFVLLCRWVHNRE
ncbi:MAG: hypothetical protein AABY07_09560, partial [Nanoarchaeota archaeon]